ncbi:MAG: glycosyltransferase family 39 protein, partial [Cyanobacteria bacterium P01_F01_bin.3]
DSSRKGVIVYLAILSILTCIRFVFLQADFPHNLGGYGMAYTDEGWWSRNAVAWVRDGDWYIDDGYNTITNLPTLPVMQVIWFKLFGIGLFSARAVTVLCSVIVSGFVYLFARRELAVKFAWIAPLIILTNYPAFAYSRMALLEMPMLVFILASLWLVTRPQRPKRIDTVKKLSAKQLSIKQLRQPYRKKLYVGIIASGLLFSVAILTKTTALFALPVIAIAIVSTELFPTGALYTRQANQSASTKAKILCQVRIVLVWLLVVGVSFGICHFILTQAGDVQSQEFFSSHNVTAKVPRKAFAFLKAPLRVIERSLTLFPLLTPGFLGAVVFLIKAGKLRSSSLFRLSVLWAGAFWGTFSLSDFAAPRYFLVLIVPFALIAPLVAETMFGERGGSVQRGGFSSDRTNSSHTRSLPLPRKVARAGIVLTVVFIASTLFSLVQVGHHLRRPQFTLVEMANAIEEYIEADSSSSSVVMGSFVDTVALAANGNITAVNDRMGFRKVEARIATFNPSYYLSIGPIGTFNEKDDPEIQAAIEDKYEPILLEQFALFDGRDFDQPIFFYRLKPR